MLVCANHARKEMLICFFVGDFIATLDIDIIGSFVRNFHIGFDPDYECH